MGAQMKKQLGFTLIELMIVIAIIGVLASIGYPSYTDYLIRGRIPDATANLATKRVQLEQFFQDNRTYAGAPACNPDTAVSKYFDFSCPVVATATPTPCRRRARIRGPWRVLFSRSISPITRPLPPFPPAGRFPTQTPAGSPAKAVIAESVNNPSGAGIKS
jgi:prepilin-type N-terminal cleavage/methylation domain-containing protein